jgi:tryptophan 2,3-dioxygenase
VNNARIAQVVERIIGNDEVPGSTPGVSTILVVLEVVNVVFYRVIRQEIASLWPNFWL